MPSPPPHRDAPLLSLAFCLAVGAVVRFGVLWGVDLRGAFGPDAPGAAAAAFSGPFSHPYPLHPLLIRVFALPSGDGVQGALLLSVAAGLATVGAAWLIGRVLTDGRDGRSTALLAAAAPLLVHSSLLRGGDALAIALVTWGVALGFQGAHALAGARTRSSRWPQVALVAAGLLCGLSAAAKPIALPATALLLAAPLMGGRRCLPWLGGGLIVGFAVALPFLGPLLRPAPAMGLLGSWWLPGPPSAGELPAWLWAGARQLGTVAQAESWSQLGPLALLAVLGCVVAAPRRGFRVGLLILSAGGLLLLAAMLGTRLQARYLAAASFGWLILAGIALTPAALRRPSGAVPHSWRRVLLGPLPLSFVATLFIMANLTLWDGLALLRAQEEGAAPPEGLFAGWAGDWRPTEAYADSSLCGALELERVAAGLVQRAPRGGTVVTLPLRDGRAWHLLGPLAAARPDLGLLELTDECCPHAPARCAELLPDALGRAGGGALVVPLEPTGRCETAALPHGLEDWASALAPVVEPEGPWSGTLRVDPASGSELTQLCDGLGGRPPAPPARP